MESNPTSPLHLDCNATTAASAEVVEAMLPWLGRAGANPSATHGAGREAARAVRRARASVAALVGASAPEIVFTSCGSESTVTAVRSAARARPGGSVVISAVEHSAT
ncbi:MAG: aminotransferase class V-fold PLP-dependent enzyme, partial [Planctomycetota bacterium]